MTDNRANEPNEAQVGAAAKAMWDLRKLSNDPEWDDLEYGVRNEYRKDARAALVAAQGAAPQAEVLPETGNELRDEDGDLISSGKHLRILQQGMYVCDTCTNVLGLNVRWDHAIKRDDHSPVLPSSGVDEDKLAEVVCLALNHRDGGEECEDDYRVARAVAEWLKEQGR